MPLRNLVRTASAVALAVPVLAGLTAISASADEIAPAPETTVTQTAPAPATQDTVAPVVATATPEPVLFTASYTRW